MKKYQYFLYILGVLALLILACSMSGNVPSGTTTPEEDATLPIGSGQPQAPTNIDGAPTIYIPGNTFRMGSNASDSAADDDEMPAHEVSLSGYYIYTHEVTQSMYASCVEAGACSPVEVLKSGPTAHIGNPAYADHPITGVDWLMARDYCEWAGGRLPTEAEWELAARGAESSRYPWGEDDPDCERVNMLGCQVPPNTTKTGSFALGNSPYGVWDVAGNAWEWVQDWYSASYYAISPSSNPLGPSIGEEKVVRGGGLYSEPHQMRGAARQAANPHRAYDDVGFRCVPMDVSVPLASPGEWHDRSGCADLDGGGCHAEDPGTDYDVEISCSADGIPTLYIGPLPEPEGSIATDIVEGSSWPLLWSSLADGTQVCRFSSPVPGEERGANFYFQYHPELDRIYLTVTIPDCSATETINYQYEMVCEQGEPTFIIYPAPGQNIYEILDGPNALMDCDHLEENGLACRTYGPPYLPEQAIAIEVSFANAASLLPIGVAYIDVTAPDCSIAGDNWELADVGCHSEDFLYTLIDTHRDDLVPGGTTWQFCTPNCDAVSGYPGRFYCITPIANGNDPFEFCLEIGSAPTETVRTIFSDFPLLAPNTCTVAIPEPGDTPSCSDYTDQGTCQTNGCTWDKGPPDGQYHCYP